MFSYYGSKSRIVNLYPFPKHDLIIEPFAGSARYSLKHFKKDVILVDKNIIIISIWNYLKQASEKDILSLPDIGYKEKIPDSLSDAEKWLIGFSVAEGTFTPATMGHKFNHWKRTKKTIAKSLFKIRHWQFIHGDFACLENVKATWFVDPPYVKGGHKYKFGSKQINYSELGKWRRERNGQTIVCENTGNDGWLDFKPLKKMVGIVKTGTYEVFWTNEKLQHQAELFA